MDFDVDTVDVFMRMPSVMVRQTVLMVRMRMRSCVDDQLMLRPQRHRCPGVRFGFRATDVCSTSLLKQLSCLMVLWLRTRFPLSTIVGLVTASWGRTPVSACLANGPVHSRLALDSVHKKNFSVSPLEPLAITKALPSNAIQCLCQTPLPEFHVRSVTNE